MNLAIGTEGEMDMHHMVEIRKEEINMIVEDVLQIDASILFYLSYSLLVDNDFIIF